VPSAASSSSSRWVCHRCSETGGRLIGAPRSTCARFKASAGVYSYILNGSGVGSLVIGRPVVEDLKHNRTVILMSKCRLLRLYQLYYLKTACLP
jgi:hypothetical protein